MSKIVSVTSGKGGVGKSTVAVGLAAALARRGLKVLLIDGDFGLGSLDIILGLSKDVVFNVYDCINGQCEVEKAILESPIYENLFLIPSPFSNQKIDNDKFNSLCRNLADTGLYNFIIIDSGAGINSDFETCVRPSELVFVVATPDNVSMRAALSVFLRLRDHQATEARMVINKFREGYIKGNMLPNIDEMIDGTGLRLIGVVSENKKIPVYTSKGEKIPDNSDFSKAFDNILERLNDKYVPIL